MRSLAFAKSQASAVPNGGGFARILALSEGHDSAGTDAPTAGPTAFLPIGRDTRTGAPVSLATRFTNRHMLICGATGSGKTVTIKRLVESFSDHGVPSLIFDAKGDLSGLAADGAGAHPPVRLLDCFGMTGEPARLSFAAMGADASARALGLSFAQAGVLDIAFAYARQRPRVRELATPSDLSRLLAELERAKGAGLGHVSPASVGVIRRALLRLDGAAFGPVAYDPRLALQFDGKRGVVSILDARRLMQSPTLYSAAVIQILESLYSTFPEVGDAPAPKLALILDEAHLIFAELEPALLVRIECIVRLIRSKGVALIFASQSPADIPPTIAAQCASRIQHAMRAATPLEARAVRAAAESMPAASGFDAARAIGELKPGEALASLVRPDGSPAPCVRARVIPPRCSLGALADGARAPMPGEAGLKRLPDGTLARPPSQADVNAMFGKLALAFTPFVLALAFMFRQTGLWEGLGALALVAAIWPLRHLWTPLLWAILWTGHRHHGRH